MNIALVFDGLQIGGIERVGADYAKILCELGHNVTIINLMPQLNEMEKEFPKTCRFKHFYYPRMATVAQYAQLTKKGFLGTLVYLAAMVLMPTVSFAFKSIFKIKRLINNDYDIMIAFSGHFNDLDFVARNFSNAKHKMCWLHGALYSYSLISYGYMNLYNKINNLIVLVDDAQEECLMYNKNLKLNINKLYNPTFINKKVVNKTNVEKLKKKYGIFLLMVSRFEYPHKDQYTVAKMLEIIRTQYGANVDLVFVGTGPEEAKVKRFVSEFSIDVQKHIHFEGSKMNVQDYYNAAYMLVHASVAGEGLPTIMIEALAYNLPMVVTDSKTGPREILGENEYGLLCKVQDPIDMAKKVNSLLSNKNLYMNYKVKIKERLMDFSPEVIKEQLKDIVSKIGSDKE